MFKWDNELEKRKRVLEFLKLFYHSLAWPSLTISAKRLLGITTETLQPHSLHTKDLLSFLFTFPQLAQISTVLDAI